MPTIKDWRKEKGWTQEELAREIGSDKFQVSRWERGKHKPCKMAQELLKRIGYDNKV